MHKFKYFFTFFSLFLLLACEKPDEKNHEKEVIEISHTPEFITNLTMQLEETSGLIHAAGKFWSHNDRSWFDHIYAFDTATGNITHTVVIEDILNVDFEDLAKDDTFIFVGDFGNNHGDRKDLVIYRVPKSELHFNGQSIRYVQVNATHFHYPEQNVFSPGNQHNFDCEAFFVKNQQYYLFTKHRTNDSTTLYRLPAVPGNFAAEKLDVFHARGRITGADISPDGNEVVLIGYNKDADVFLWFFYDFEGDDFFSGEKIYVNLGPFDEIGQAEAVCYAEGLNYLLISAEKTNGNPPKLYRFPLSAIR